MTDDNSNDSDSTDSNSVESSDSGGGTKYGRLKKLKPTNDFGRIYPYLYYSALFGVVIGGPILAIQHGIIQPSINLLFNLSFNADLGIFVELGAAALLVLFVLFSLVMLARIAGIGFLNSLLSIAIKMMSDFDKDDLP